MINSMTSNFMVEFHNFLTHACIYIYIYIVAPDWRFPCNPFWDLVVDVQRTIHKLLTDKSLIVGSIDDILSILWAGFVLL